MTTSTKKDIFLSFFGDPPKPGETVTIMNQPGTPELRSLVDMCSPAFTAVIVEDGTWFGDLLQAAVVEKFSRIYSAAATQIHAGLWRME